MMKYTKEDLKKMQSWSLERKIQVTQTRIIEWYQRWEGKVYVSFSGGKDSTVLLDLARRIYPDIEAVFIDTGLEYPEIREFVKTIDNVITVKPEMNFKKVIDKYGYPILSKNLSQYIYQVKTTKSDKLRNLRLYGEGTTTTMFSIPEKYKYIIDAPFNVSHKCCDIMKKKPAHNYDKESGKHPIIATMACESIQRRNTYLKQGCNAFDKKNPSSQPMSFWTEQDVLRYLKEFNISYSSIYGDITEENGILKTTGEKRTGCMFCMFGVHLEPEPNRFQKMQVTHPKLWDYCMYNLGLKEVLEYIGVPWNNDNEGLWTTKDLIEKEC